MRDQVRDLADATGGHALELSGARTDQALREVLGVLRATYVVAYPVERNDSQRQERPWRRVQIEVAAPAARVVAPVGYYAGASAAASANAASDAGAWLLSQGSLGTAQQALLAANEIAPGSWQNQLRLATLFRWREELEIALRHANTAVQIHPGIGESLVAELALALGRMDLATQYALRAHRAGQELPAALRPLLETEPAPDDEHVGERLAAPRIFVDPGTAPGVLSALALHRLAEEFARAIMDTPTLGLTRDRGKADWLLWFDIAGFDEPRGEITGHLRLNRPGDSTRRLPPWASNSDRNPFGRLRHTALYGQRFSIRSTGAAEQLERQVRLATDHLNGWVQSRRARSSGQESGRSSAGSY